MAGRADRTAPVGDRPVDEGRPEGGGHCGHDHDRIRAPAQLTGVGANADADHRLRELARAARMVFFAGLPGTGKSFFVHRLAHLCHAAGRTVHLLQWDRVRPVFEASPAGRRYPLRDGVTHPVIRKAAGAWSRQALARWAPAHGDPAHLLVGEAPLVGGRFIELARRADDRAEPWLDADACQFVIPVPAPDVRRFLEAERARRMTRAQHVHEREDAPSNVVRQLWDEMRRAARSLGILTAKVEHSPGIYDPSLYEAVYERVLKHRHRQVLFVQHLLGSDAVSVHAFAFAPHHLIPDTEEAAAHIRGVEERFPDESALEAEMNDWFLT